ncbi:MAG: [NiFe]-hydrogenase assembly chaperone HybE [Rhodoferax sp.]
MTDWFAQVARTRMHGVPVLNDCLQVDHVGFECLVEEGAQWLCGILVTPWFMNLVRLPVQRAQAGVTLLGVGEVGQRQVGRLVFDFIGAHEDRLGGYEACSLFSPMFDFADHSAALATAREVLRQTGHGVPQPDPETRQVEVPSRRNFLFGRAARSVAT